MNDKNLPLLLQSSRDALAECLGDLDRAVEVVDRMDRQGEAAPVKPGQLERARAQCLAAHRALDEMVRRLS